MALVDVIFLVLFLMGALSAIAVAFHPNILYAAVALIFSLITVSGIYAVLGADFLAAAQLIIYVGGVIVVILFALMMSRDIYQARLIERAKSLILPFIICGAVFAGLFSLLMKTSWGPTAAPSSEPTTDAIGLALTGPYALVFQYVAIVLLFGLIGAVVIARPHIGHDDEELG